MVLALRVSALNSAALAWNRTEKNIDKKIPVKEADGERRPLATASLHLQRYLALFGQVKSSGTSGTAVGDANLVGGGLDLVPVLGVIPKSAEIKSQVEFGGRLAGTEQVIAGTALRLALFWLQLVPRVPASLAGREQQQKQQSS